MQTKPGQHCHTHENIRKLLERPGEAELMHEGPRHKGTSSPQLGGLLSRQPDAQGMTQQFFQCARVMAVYGPIKSVCVCRVNDSKPHK